MLIETIPPPLFFSLALRNCGAADKGGKKAYCCISNTTQILELLGRTALVFTVMLISLGKMSGSRAMVPYVHVYVTGLRVCLWDTEGFRGGSPSATSHTDSATLNTLGKSFTSHFILEAFLKCLLRLGFLKSCFESESPDQL